MAFGMVIAADAMDEQLEKINGIKKNPDYLYGDATMATQEEATSLAYEVLQKEVLNWSQREHQKLKVSSAAEINGLSQTIRVRRANMFRVFAYVKKESLLKDSHKVQVDSLNRDSVEVRQPKDSLVTDSVKNVIMQRFFGRRVNDALLRLKDAKNFFELKDIIITGDVIGNDEKMIQKIIDANEQYCVENKPNIVYIDDLSPSFGAAKLSFKEKINNTGTL
jgi:hypothetical protein